MAGLTANRPIRLRSVAILVAMLAVAAASQIAIALRPPSEPPGAVPTDSLGPTIEELDGGIPFRDGDVASGAGEARDPGLARATDIDRIKANVAFWSKRVEGQPDDFVSSNRLGTSEIELARASGDVTAYLRAEGAFDLTLRRDPHNAAALGYKGSVLVSLHRFTDAQALARQVLARRANDPVALATLGDASLELGDLDNAQRAYEHADAIAHGSSTLTRLAHLAFIRGDVVAAIRIAWSAVHEGTAEGVEGERAAFLHYQLGEILAGTGDLRGAGAAYAAAFKADPGSFLARSGLARVAAANGELDDGIARLSDAIAIVPQPEFVARRGDLYTLRAKAGDDRRAADDYATVEAIARLAGEAAGIYDRTLVYYLANHGLDPERAVRLAATELDVRKDVYGYDAYAWALLSANRVDKAQAAMESALAVGTRDARLLYHAGMIAAARGDTTTARSRLEAALALDPSFDPLQAKRARDTLANLR
jgi:tetratricopeptide (TPR) repeat protein